MAWHDVACVGKTRHLSDLQGERISGRIAAAMEGSLRHGHFSVMATHKQTPRGEPGDRISASGRKWWGGCPFRHCQNKFVYLLMDIVEILLDEGSRCAVCISCV
jgi:hypothetical protein